MGGLELTAYLVNFALLFGWAALFLWRSPDRQNRKLFCVLASLQWIALSGLRHVSVGADTFAYKLQFERILTTSWREVLGSAWGTYFGPLDLKDPGYAVFVKVLQVVTSDYQLYLVLIAMIFTIPLGVFIYRYSADPLLSFLIYSSLFYSFFAITGIRQTVATALVVFIGYRFIEQRRLVPFLLTVLLAFTLHKSSAVFLLFYPLAAIRLSTWGTLALLSGAVVAFVYRLELMEVLGIVSGYEQYSGQFEGAGAWVFLAMLLVVIALTLLRLKGLSREQSHVNASYNALLLALVFTPLVFVDPNAMRVVQYFSLFSMILVPSVIRSFRDPNERALVSLVAASLLIFLFARSNPQYLFFWQGL